MGKKIDHRGKRYGRVTGVEQTTTITKTGQLLWLWQCDCGNLFEAVGAHFHSKGYSAGCPSCVLKIRGNNGKRTTTHGRTRTKEYAAWLNIKKRCTNKSSPDYKDYGGVGITICPEWDNNFELFLSHIGECPLGGKYSVDRIDFNGNYEPGNVRWATDEQQARNRGIASNNTSGVTGVYLLKRVSKSGVERITFAARWSDINRGPRSREYSVEKYGEELAFFLACEKRELEIMKLNLLGAGYSPYHGK